MLINITRVLGPSSWILKIPESHRINIKDTNMTRVLEPSSWILKTPENRRINIKVPNPYQRPLECRESGFQLRIYTCNPIKHKPP